MDSNIPQRYPRVGTEDFWRSCEDCRLSYSCSSPFLGIRGNMEAEVLVVGESPSRVDDEKGRTFSGKSAELLAGVLSDIGLDEGSYAMTNVLHCCKTNGEAPSKVEIDACKGNLFLEMLSMPNLKIVLLLGTTAYQTCVLRRRGISSVHGKVESHDGLLYYPVYHPASVIRDPSLGKEFTSDMTMFGNIVASMSDKSQHSSNYDTISSRSDMDAMVSIVRETGECSFDLETKGLSPFYPDTYVIGIGVSPRPKEAYFIPVQHTENTCSKEDIEYFLSEFNKVLEDASIGKIAQNAEFDILFMECKYGITVRNLIFDTMLAEYAIDENKRSYGLKKMALEYTDMGAYDIALDTHLEVRGIGMADLDKASLSVIGEYCCMDADATMRIREKQIPILEKEGMTEVFNTLLIPGMLTFKNIKKRGIAVDVDKLSIMEVEVPKLLQEKEDRLRSYPSVIKFEKTLLDRARSKVKNKVIQEVKMPFGSSQKLSELLYEVMGYECKKVTKKGGKSTDKEALKKLGTGDAFLKDLNAWKGVNTAYTKYINKIRDEWLMPDDRVHGSYNLHTTVTGRASSNGPNMQQIPRKDTTPEVQIKELLVPSDGCVFLHADYSQAELRILAVYSRDEALIRAFNSGMDIHSAVAAEIFDIPIEEFMQGVADKDSKYVELRNVAKVINFGLIYGMGVAGMARTLGYDEETARAYIEKYFSRFPGVCRWIEEIHKSVKRTGVVVSKFGRKRRIPYANSNDRATMARAERQAVNSPIQGTASDLTLTAMIRIDKYISERGMRSAIVMTVHDSIVLDVPLEEKEEMTRVLRDIMENHGVPWIDVPIVADVESGESLASLSLEKEQVVEDME